MFRKKKFWIVSIIVLIVIILGILIVVNKRKEDRSFINYDYPSTIYVDNQTEYKRIDTIVYVLSSKIMKIDTISMHIFGMPRHLDRDDFEFYGLVEKAGFGEHVYKMFIKEGMGFRKLKRVLSHEFVHVDQYERGDLEIVREDWVWKGDTLRIKDPVFKYIWKGDTVCFRDVEYEDREFEIEAFNREDRVNSVLNEWLYHELFLRE